MPFNLLNPPIAAIRDLAANAIGAAPAAKPAKPGATSVTPGPNPGDAMAAPGAHASQLTGASGSGGSKLTPGLAAPKSDLTARTKDIVGSVLGAGTSAAAEPKEPTPGTGDAPSTGGTEGTGAPTSAAAPRAPNRPMVIQPPQRPGFLRRLIPSSNAALAMLMTSLVPANIAMVALNGASFPSWGLSFGFWGALGATAGVVVAFVAVLCVINALWFWEEARTYSQLAHKHDRETMPTEGTPATPSAPTQDTAPGGSS